MRGPRKLFVRGGPILTKIFFFFLGGGGGGIYYILVDEGRKDPNTTISRPTSARQWNAIKWRFAGVPMMSQH